MLEQLGDQIATEQFDRRIPVSSELVNQIIAKTGTSVTVRGFVERAVAAALFGTPIIAVKPEAKDPKFVPVLPPRPMKPGVEGGAA